MVLEQALTALVAAQTGTQRALRDLVEAQRRSEERLSRVESALATRTDRVARAEEQIAALAEAQRRTEERVQGLEMAIKRLAGQGERLGQAVGQLRETVGSTAEEAAADVLEWLCQQRGHRSQPPTWRSTVRLIWSSRCSTPPAGASGVWSRSRSGWAGERSGTGTSAFAPKASAAWPGPACPVPSCPASSAGGWTAGLPRPPARSARAC